MVGGKKDNPIMAGLSWRSLRSNYALMPLFACMGLGTAFVIFHAFHVAAKSPEVILDKKGVPVPWDPYRDGKKYKYYAYNDSFTPVSKMEGRPDV